MNRTPLPSTSSLGSPWPKASESLRHIMALAVLVMTLGVPRDDRRGFSGWPGEELTDSDGAIVQRPIANLSMPPQILR
jgi:hypothetical protein